MHQQLSLYGSIRNNELTIVFQSLAAVSGMNPIQIFDHCACYIPKYRYRPQLKAGEVNQIEQYRMTLRTNMINTDYDYKIPHTLEKNRQELKKLTWKMCINELPEAGKLNYLSQSQFSSTIIDGDPFLLADQLGYKFAREYWLQAYEFVFGNLVVTIYRILVTNEFYDQNFSTTLAGNSGRPNETKDEKNEKKPAGNEPKDTKDQSYVLVDPSGSWIVKAYVNVQNVTDLEGISEAANQLERFQTEMSPLFELVSPDRKNLDSIYRE